MNIIGQLEADLKEATLHQEKLKLDTLRLLKNALQNYQIEVGHDLNTDEALKVLQKEAKKRQDSISAYKQAKRDDLVDQEEKELKIIDQYLPEKMDEAQIEKVVEKVIEQSGAKDLSSMGQVIGMAMKETQGNADGATVSRIVKEKLS